MNQREYYNKCKNALDYGTLNSTVHELLLGQEIRLANEVRSNMQRNLIVKPPLHNSVQELTSNHYLIEMNSEDIDSIVDFLFDLEAKSISPEGQATPETALYSSLVDAWSNISRNFYDRL